MNRYRRVTFPVLSLLLVLAMLSSLFAGCSRQSGQGGDPGSDSSASPFTSADNAISGAGSGSAGGGTTAGGRTADPLALSDAELDALEAELLGTLQAEAEPDWITDFPAVSSWDGEVAMPWFNPMGAKSAYSQVKWEPNQSKTWSWVGEDNRLTNTKVAGDVWTLKVTGHDGQEAFLFLLDSYGRYRGLTPHTMVSGDERMFVGEDEAGTRWWARAKVSAKDATLTITRERRLLPGVPFTITTADYKDGKLWFSTESPADAYLSLQAELSDGVAMLTADQSLTRDAFTRKSTYRKPLDTREGARFLLGDIPQDPGLLNWQLSWGKKDAPKTVTLTLIAMTGLEKPDEHEQLGAIRVRNSAYGSVTVEPYRGSGTVLTHPEYDKQSLRGDTTPDGDVIFWLPAGYWDVLVTPSTDKVSFLKAGMIPVHAGRETLVTLPAAMQTAFTPASQSVAADKGMEILESRDLGETAEVIFSLSDPETRDLPPTLDNTEITEGGADGRLLSVERLQTPPNVVLLLDSSGSMKGQMEKTVAAAQAFINGLPDNAVIQLVDFDTTQTLVEGTTKAAALAGLKTVKANGATSLNDSILLGVKLLEKKQRPTLIVFTDGMDANANDTGPGSKATPKQVFDGVAAAGIPLFTIGFGDKHDVATLQKLADLSGGRYYSAANPQVLEQVFAAINAKLGNTFKAVYERPRKITSGDVPVLSLVFDTSGSMNHTPQEPGCDYRMQKTQNLFSDFVKELPEDTLVQVTDFDTKVRIVQMLTNNRPQMLSAIGQLEPGGGTEIHKALISAYDTLKAIPSTRKAMVFLTDAALNIQDRVAFDKLLTQIKTDNIRILWTGLGVEVDEAAFRTAAEKSGGRHVISEDPEVLKQALDALMNEIRDMPASTRTNLRVTVRKRTETGVLHTYSGGQLVTFSPQPDAKEKSVPDTVRVEAGPAFSQYDAAMAALVYGSDTPSTDTRITKRIPLDGIKGENKALRWEVHEAVYAERLQGLSAPKNMRFLGIHLTMTNIMPTQEVVVYPDGSGHPSSWVSGGGSKGVVKQAKVPYLIKDIASHLFLGLNNTSQSPASPLTWLAETPLVAPGSRELFLQPDMPVSGMVFFLVPDMVTDQVSLHLYDTAWGHIDTPLMGTMDVKRQDVAKLPTSVTGKLSDTFSLKVEGLEKTRELAGLTSAKTGSFVLLDGTLEAKVQALLDIAPADWMRLALPTDKGTFLLEPHAVTGLLPFGFLQKTVFAPGSFNKIRMAFEVPKPLLENPMALFTDLRDQDLTLALAGNPPAAPTAASAPKAATHKGDGMTLTVNGLYESSRVGSSAGNGYLVADITVFDSPDGLATRGLDKGFRLVKGNGETVPVSPYTDEMLLGFGGDAVVYDGGQRRGLVAFPNDKKDPGRLTSTFFPTLDMPVGTPAKLSEDWTIPATGLVKDNAGKSWEQALKAALDKAVRKHEALAAVNPPALSVATTDEKGTEQIEKVAVPPATLAGAKTLATIDGEDELAQLLRRLSWRPGRNNWTVRYAPEAVLTQGWGTEGDLALLAEKALARMGFSPKHRTVTLTDKGKTFLEKRHGLQPGATVPALAYRDAAGADRLLVLPFGRDLAELGGLAYLEPDAKEPPYTMESLTVTVVAEVEPKDGTVAGQMGGIGSALGGGSGKAATEDVKLLETKLNLADASLDAVDLGFTLVGGRELRAWLDTSAGLVMGNGTLNKTEAVCKALRVTLSPESGAKQTHRVVLADKEEPENLFLTYGLNLPDLPQAAAKALQADADRVKGSNPEADDLSALKWYTRSIINRFTAGQTLFEAETAGKLEVVAARTGTPRMLAVTIQKEGGRLRTGMDLLQAHADMLAGSTEAKTGFLAMTGLTATEWEAAVLPAAGKATGNQGGSGNTAGNKGGSDAGIGLFEIWEKLPADASYVLLSPKERAASGKAFQQAGMPDEVSKRLLALDKETFILIPNRPAKVDGRERWAWLEMRKDGRTIGVLDTGAHGSMVEVSIEEWVTEANMFIVGALVGTSTSIWAVSSFSLELTDAEAIYQAAYKFAMGIKDLLEFKNGPAGYSIGGMPEIGGSHEGLKVTFGTDGITLGQDILGFANGYEKGVKHYFGVK